MQCLKIASFTIEGSDYLRCLVIAPLSTDKPGLYSIMKVSALEPSSYAALLRHAVVEIPDDVIRLYTEEEILRGKHCHDIRHGPVPRITSAA